MRILALILLGFVLGACQSTSPAPETTAAPQTLTAESYVMSDEASLAPPPGLRSFEVQEDIRFLIGALERGYGGRKYVPQDKMQKALSDLAKINSAMPSSVLKNQIDEILYQIPDSHLMATINWEPSPLRKSREKTGHVGKNLLQKSGNVWSTGIHYDWGKKGVLAIAISRFPSRMDPNWQGFLPSIKGFMRDASLIVLDLRGNGGGDDTMGIELAKLLTGDNFRYPISKRIERNTPEARAIFWNGIKLKILSTRQNGKPVPEHFLTLDKERKASFDEVNKGGLPEEKSFSFLEEEYSSVGEPGFKKPIYILMDGECASSCESTIDGFENQKNVTRVGEATAGFIHFGNAGNIVLPYSKIVVQIPIHYFEYGDKRFLERTGIQPDLKVPEGTDALEFLRDKLKLRK